jgi:hypothetical protein
MTDKKLCNRFIKHNQALGTWGLTFVTVLD